MLEKPKGIIKNSLVAVAGEIIPLHLKKQILLYDQIVVFDCDTALSMGPKWKELDKNVNYDVELGILEHLIDTNVVIDVPDINKAIFESFDVVKTPTEFMNLLPAAIAYADLITSNIDAKKMAEKIRQPDFIEGLKGKGLPAEFLEIGTRRVMDHAAYFQMLARGYAQTMEHKFGVTAHALIPDEIVYTKGMEKMKNDLFEFDTDLVEVLLSKVPFPDELTPLEQILEFRQHPENRAFLSGLRSWMHEATKETVSKNEISEKLDWMIHERKRHLQKERLASSYGTIGSVLIGGVTLAEKLVKIQWADLAKDIVQILPRKADLLQIEMDAPNGELHYLLKLEKEFGNN